MNIITDIILLGYILVNMGVNIDQLKTVIKNHVDAFIKDISKTVSITQTELVIINIYIYIYIRLMRDFVYQV